MDAIGRRYDEKQGHVFVGKNSDQCLDAEDITEKVLHEARVFIIWFYFAATESVLSVCRCVKNKINPQQALNRI